MNQRTNDRTNEREKKKKIVKVLHILIKLSFFSCYIYICILKDYKSIELIIIIIINIRERERER